MHGKSKWLYLNVGVSLFSFLQIWNHRTALSANTGLRHASNVLISHPLYTVYWSKSNKFPKNPRLEGDSASKGSDALPYPSSMESPILTKPFRNSKIPTTTLSWVFPYLLNLQKKHKKMHSEPLTLRKIFKDFAIHIENLYRQNLWNWKEHVIEIHTYNCNCCIENKIFKTSIVDSHFLWTQDCTRTHISPAPRSAFNFRLQISLSTPSSSQKLEHQT